MIRQVRGLILCIGCLFCYFSIALAVDPQPGEPHDLGVGVLVGSPTGLSLKYWTSYVTALDAGFAWRFGDEDRFQFHADHLWHISIDSFRVPEGRLPVYVGLGVRVLGGHDAEGGIRIPFGLSYLMFRVPLEVFAEIAPVVEFAPDTDASLDGGIGLRYYFR